MSSRLPAHPRPSRHPSAAARRAPRTAHVWIAASLGLATALVGSAGAAVAQAGVGARYGAHDPRACPTMEATANRPPDLATATAAAICAKEGVRFGNLFLLSNVSLQVGRGTPYRLLGERARPNDADVTATVYSIRGSYAMYLCSPLGGSYAAGQTCTRSDHSRAEGWCYRNNFGTWSCDFDGGQSASPDTPNQPPPRN